MWYIIIGIILVLLLSSNNKSSKKEGQIKDVGMYFMEVHEGYRKNNNVQSVYNESIEDFYFVLGCASQGRLDDIKEIYKNAKQENQLLFNLITDFKPQIDKMTKVSKRVSDAKIGYDMKDGESIGEYESRKLKRSKVFMTEFNYFKNLDLISYLNQKK